MKLLVNNVELLDRPKQGFWDPLPPPAELQTMLERLGLGDRIAVDQGEEIVPGESLVAGWGLSPERRRLLEREGRRWVSLRPLPWIYRRTSLELEASFRLPPQPASPLPTPEAIPGAHLLLIGECALILPGPPEQDLRDGIGEFQFFEQQILELYRDHAAVIVPAELVGHGNRGAFLFNLGVHIRFDPLIVLFQARQVRTLAGSHPLIRPLAEACGRQSVVWEDPRDCFLIRRRLLNSRSFWDSLLQAGTFG